MGVPVVATAWSGNLDFMDETTACLVPTAMVPVDDAQGIYSGQVWADPDIDIAAGHLRRLRSDPDFAFGLAERAKGNAARKLASEAWFKSLPSDLKAALSSQ